MRSALPSWRYVWEDTTRKLLWAAAAGACVLPIAAHLMEHHLLMPQSMKRRAVLIVDTFNGMEGVHCNPVEGAMYAFPQLTLPRRAMVEASKQGKQADFMYCQELLDETGIVTVPGSGFGQEEGTFHLRTTILPMEEKIQQFISLFKTFHNKVCERSRGPRGDTVRVSHPYCRLRAHCATRS